MMIRNLASCFVFSVLSVPFLRGISEKCAGRFRNCHARKYRPYSGPVAKYSFHPLGSLDDMERLA